MLGYWNKKEDTDKAIKNGWLYTGDIGEIDPEDGYLKITDRKKDIIVNAGGDNISPSRVEEKLNIEPEIAQSMMYGDFKNYLVAIIVPDKDQALQWAKDRGKEPESLRPLSDFQWFWGIEGDGSVDDRTDFISGGAFDGNRWNDLHYTRANKESARERNGTTVPA